MKELSWSDFNWCVNEIANKIQKNNKEYTSIYGIPRGGLVLAVALSHRLNIPVKTERRVTINPSVLVVDDIADTGTTIRKLLKGKDSSEMPLREFYDIDIAVLILNPRSTYIPTYYCMINKKEDWIHFPWECKTTQDTISIMQKREDQ